MEDLKFMKVLKSLSIEVMPNSAPKPPNYMHRTKPSFQFENTESLTYVNDTFSSHSQQEVGLLRQV